MKLSNSINFLALFFFISLNVGCNNFLKNSSNFTEEKGFFNITKAYKLNASESQFFDTTSVKRNWKFRNSRKLSKFILSRALLDKNKGKELIISKEEMKIYKKNNPYHIFLKTEKDQYKLCKNVSPTQIKNVYMHIKKNILNKSLSTLNLINHYKNDIQDFKTQNEILEQIVTTLRKEAKCTKNKSQFNIGYFTGLCCFCLLNILLSSVIAIIPSIIYMLLVAMCYMEKKKSNAQIKELKKLQLKVTKNLKQELEVENISSKMKTYFVSI